MINFIFKGHTGEQILKRSLPPAVRADVIVLVPVCYQDNARNNLQKEAFIQKLRKIRFGIPQ